jgi:hypothetical protein
MAVAGIKVLQRQIFIRHPRPGPDRSTTEQRTLFDQYQLSGLPASVFYSKNGIEPASHPIVGEIDGAGLAGRLIRANDQI